MHTAGCEAEVIKGIVIKFFACRNKFRGLSVPNIGSKLRFKLIDRVAFRKGDKIISNSRKPLLHYICHKFIAHQIIIISIIIESILCFPKSLNEFKTRIIKGIVNQRNFMAKRFISKENSMPALMCQKLPA